MSIWRELALFAQFKTPRLHLCPVSFDRHRQAFFEIISDSDNVTFLFPAVADSMASDELLVETFMRQPLGIWAVEDRKSHQLLGIIRFEKLNPRSQQAEMGYFLRKEWRNQGLMTEALRHVVFLAFHQFGLRKLLLKTHAENKASQAVAQKAGFQISRCYRGSDRYSRKTRQYIDFVLTKTEWRLAKEENDYIKITT